MSYGLLSALSWGISTLLAAVAARRIGALRTVVIGEVAGLAGYLTLLAGRPLLAARRRRQRLAAGAGRGDRGDRLPGHVPRPGVRPCRPGQRDLRVLRRGDRAAFRVAAPRAADRRGRRRHRGHRRRSSPGGDAARHAPAPVSSAPVPPAPVPPATIASPPVPPAPVAPAAIASPPVLPAPVLPAPSAGSARRPATSTRPPSVWRSAWPRPSATALAVS